MISRIRSPVLSPVLQWLPGETLFSLICRQRVISGHVSAASTAVELFGEGQLSIAHDFPRKLDVFVQRAAGCLGDAETIIRQRTILPFYLRHISISDSAAAITAMRGNGLGSLKYRLGIAKKGFKMPNFLKACPDCLQEDERTHGVGYWRLAHQYPGTWICLQHKTLLLFSSTRGTESKSHFYLLPEKIGQTPPCDLSSMSSPSLLLTLMSLAESANCISSLPKGFHFDLNALQATYVAELSKKGLISQGGALNFSSVGMSFFNAIAPLLAIPELASIPCNEKVAARLVFELLRVPRAGIHPLFDLLAIYWLYERWDLFFIQYQRIALNSADESTSANNGRQSRTRTVQDCSMVTFDF